MLTGHDTAHKKIIRVFTAKLGILVFFCIMQTCLCNLHPLTPHFYIVKLGFTGVCGSNVYPKSMF